ncbi:MAG TPA: MFS transporter [Phycicoccus sp.]|nr:MFS transporter [Phycicoccus sp.]HQK32499.1 MFS transporter [Phycicoccus sp.]
MTPVALPVERVREARNATFALFALAGVAFASWASRIPDAKVQLDLSAGELGATLFAMSLGSVIALPLTGRVVERFGMVRTIKAGFLTAAIGAVAIGLAIDVAHSRALTMVALFFIGAGIAGWDVAMNLEGADVERHLGKAIMPQFHAAFSGGTVATALFGAAMSWAKVSILIHLSVTALVCLAVGFWATTKALPHEATAAGAAAATRAETGERGKSAWLEGKTLLIGLVVLVAAFTEGTANDWLAVAFHEGHELPTWAGVLGFATFLTFMTIGRIWGTRLLDERGRVPVLRVSFGLAVVGAALVIFGNAPLAFIGAAIWGLGAALGFPVGMSASADDPARAAARMSVVATIGYAAFIAGPPLLGFLGDHVGVLRSLTVVGAGAILALLLVTAVREPSRAEGTDEKVPA